MRKSAASICFSALTCLLTGCFGLIDSGTDGIIDDYEVGWIDFHAQRALNKKGENQMVPAYVFAVGHNPKFIFAKQHPLVSGTDDKILNSITNYYIVERATSRFQNKPVYGPLSEKAFYLQCAKLGVKEVAFDTTYPENIN